MENSKSEIRNKSGNGKFEIRNPKFETGTGVGIENSKSEIRNG